jgi:CubicO group peptidase (beta-lactamase class C family)
MPRVTPLRRALLRASLGVCASFLAASAYSQPAQPLQASDEPDADLLGRAAGYPVAPSPLRVMTPAFQLGSWSSLDKVPGIRSAWVARPAQTRTLARAVAPPPIRYRTEGQQLALEDYLRRHRVTGLLVLKNGEIVAEHYRYDRNDKHRFLSASMAKSVTSLLIGMAQAKGQIASLDDLAERYARDLAGSPYGATSIRHLLRMSSGLTFTERYDGKDDVARLNQASHSGKPTVPEVLRSITARHAPPGEKFVYASAETEVLGRVLTAATGRNMADLTREWLWEPLGAEQDAFWCTDPAGQEGAYHCFNATLRDWGRLGLLMAQDGQVGERQVVPRDYVLEATDPARQPPALQPLRATPYLGYGYQFWLLPLKERTFVMQGVYGQAVYVQPSSGIVMVQTAVWPNANGQQDPRPRVERNALWMGVLESLGGSTARR